MNRIIQILIKSHVFFLFIILEVFSFSMLSSNSLSVEIGLSQIATNFSGFIFSKEKNIKNYFSLIDLNNKLLKDNQNLICENEELKEKLKSIKTNEIKLLNQSNIIQANVVKNSWRKKRNYIIIDKGLNDSLSKDMGVMYDNNVIGKLTDHIGNNFSIIMSILNEDFGLHGKIKNSGHFGKLNWNGHHYNKIQLNLPKHANPKIGDTIITTGFDGVFPEGVNIGIINHIKEEKNTNFINIDIKLFTDLTKIEYIYLIEPELKKERIKMNKDFQDLLK